jgi:hypothetical protein
MRKFQIMFLFAIMGVMFMAADCVDGVDGGSKSNRDQALKQEAMQQESNAQTGFPNVHNFTMKKQMKMIIEACDQENLVCYAYTVSEMTGKRKFQFKCIGYGLPYATQFTNPEVDIYTNSASSIHHNLPQADPDGLYKPSNAEGTWVMAINPKDGSVHVIYSEPKLMISPFELDEN